MSDDKVVRASKKKAEKAEKEAQKLLAKEKAKKSDKKDRKSSSKTTKDKDGKKKKDKASKKNAGATIQRNKLRMVAKMMKGGKSPEPNLDADESGEFCLLPKNKTQWDKLGLVLDLGSQRSSNDSSNSSCEDDVSTSTHTTSEMDSNTFHSCNSKFSLGSSSAHSYSSGGGDDASVSSARSFLSRANVAAAPLQVMNTWDAAKQIDDYVPDLAEHVIVHMIRLCPDRNIRQDVGIKTFRGEVFTSLAHTLVDTVDILVTMLGPEVDDYELLEIGDDLEERGVQPELFCSALTHAMQDLMGDVAFGKDVRESWDQAFGCVARRMVGA